MINSDYATRVACTPHALCERNHMGKTKDKPKPARSSEYSPKAGPKSGARRNGGGRSSVRRINEPGLFDRIREYDLEEAASRLIHSHQVTPADFLIRLDKELTKDADQAQWSLETRNLVSEYAKQLVTGDAKRPIELNGTPLRKVRWRFALCNAFMDCTDPLPGDNESWYNQALKAEADAFALRCRTGS